MLIVQRYDMEKKQIYGKIASKWQGEKHICCSVKSRFPFTPVVPEFICIGEVMQGSIALTFPFIKVSFEAYFLVVYYGHFKSILPSFSGLPS